MSKTATALTMYIFISLMFTFCAMIYYGFILFKIRTQKKIKDENQTNMYKNVNEEDKYERIDTFAFLIYILSFISFNVIYTIRYMA